MERYEIINHGVCEPDYFQGCDTAFSAWENVVTGIGANAAEAYADAVENVYQADEGADRLHLPKRPQGIRARDRVPANRPEAWYHVSIRW